MKPRTAAQLATGKFIVDCEARRDSQGRLQVYRLPKADGGGTFEIAGINDRFHSQAAKKLAALIAKGQHLAAEQLARDYILDYTDVVVGWHPHVAIEAYLRDCAFNRGPTGAARIYQRAIGVRIDGRPGTVTRATGAAFVAAELLPCLRRAREAYERQIAPPIGARAKFWRGLENRWNKSLTFAQSLL